MFTKKAFRYLFILFILTSSVHNLYGVHKNIKKSDLNTLREIKKSFQSLHLSPTPNYRPNKILSEAARLSRNLSVLKHIEKTYQDFEDEAFEFSEHIKNDFSLFLAQVPEQHIETLKHHLEKNSEIIEAQLLKDFEQSGNKYLELSRIKFSLECIQDYCTNTMLEILDAINSKIEQSEEYWNTSEKMTIELEELEDSVINLVTKKNPKLHIKKEGLIPLIERNSDYLSKILLVFENGSHIQTERIRSLKTTIESNLLAIIDVCAENRNSIKELFNHITSKNQTVGSELKTKDQLNYWLQIDVLKRSIEKRIEKKPREDDELNNFFINQTLPEDGYTYLEKILDEPIIREDIYVHLGGGRNPRAKTSNQPKPNNDRNIVSQKFQPSSTKEKSLLLITIILAAAYATKKTIDKKLNSKDIKDIIQYDVLGLHQEIDLATVNTIAQELFLEFSRNLQLKKYLAKQTRTLRKYHSYGQRLINKKLQDLIKKDTSFIDKIKTSPNELELEILSRELFKRMIILDSDLYLKLQRKIIDRLSAPKRAILQEKILQLLIAHRA